jgi:hypothetical protein
MCAASVAAALNDPRPVREDGRRLNPSLAPGASHPVDIKMRVIFVQTSSIVDGVILRDTFPVQHSFRRSGKSLSLGVSEQSLF